MAPAGRLNVLLLAVCVLTLLGGHGVESFRLSPLLGTLVSPFLSAMGPENKQRCKAQQVHLATTGNPSQMRVMWKTHSSACATKVHYGEGRYEDTPAANALLLRSPNVQGKVKTYSASDMCASPARDYKYDPLILHDVVLTDLKPGRSYSYKVAGGHIRQFQASPPTGRKEGFQFLVYGDMGDPNHRQAKAPGAAATAKYVHRDVMAGADMVLHVGDIAYANGRENVWDSFMEAIEPVASRVPYMVAVGNHEYDYSRGGNQKGADPSGGGPYSPGWGNFGNDSGGECGVTVATRFSMPGADFQGLPPRLNASVSAAAASGGVQASVAGSGSSSSGEKSHASTGSSDNAVESHRHYPANPPFWYSYDYGSVHFVVVSSEHNLHKHSQQYKWLKHDLKRVDRCVTPWVVLAMHRPMYVVFPHKSNRIVGEHLRRQLEALLNKHRVDLVFSGHVHSYARTCNVLAGKCTDMRSGGMTHITLGCAGHRLSDVNHDQEDWLVTTYTEFGYGRVTVADGYSLTFEYVRTKDGKVKDSYRLENSRADANMCFENGQPIVGRGNDSGTAAV